MANMAIEEAGSHRVEEKLYQNRYLVDAGRPTSRLHPTKFLRPC